MKRKRVYAKARAQAVKRQKTSGMLVPRPRFKAMADVTVPTIKPEFRATMKYFDNITINPGAGLTGAYVFRANGLFDPNATGVGHQPVGFDEIMALYAEYIVIGTHIRVIGRSITTNENILFGVFLKRTTTTSADFREYVENGHGVYKAIDGPGLGGTTTKEVEMKVDIAKDALTNIMIDPDWFGSVASNPVEGRYFHVVVSPFNFSTDLGAQEFTVELTFDVVFRDRINTAIS